MNEYELQIATGNAYTLAIPNSKGDDGITPTVTVTDITGGHHVAFSYGSGDPRNTSFDVMDGSDGTNGQDGQDGITPTVVVTNITGGHNVAFNYGTGDSRNTNFDVLNGDPGQGIASGGTAGQVLKKASATDYDTEWADESGGGAFFVTLTYSNGNYYSDKTYAEISDAYNNGLQIIVKQGASIIPLTKKDYNGFHFTIVSTDTDGQPSQVKAKQNGFRIYEESSTTKVQLLTQQTVYGVPSGGSVGQVLAKIGGTGAQDYGWATAIVPSVYCGTAGATQTKIGTCTNFHLNAKSYIFVLMAYDNTFTAGSLFLNINGTGAKSIYINGAFTDGTNNNLPAGTYIVYYDGTNYHFRTDGKIPNVDDGGAFFVNITGSSPSSRSSDKTVSEIKAAVDAGKVVIANIANDGIKAYLFSCSSTQAVFRSLPTEGLSNEYSSIMYYSYSITGANSNSVNRYYTSVTSADFLVGIDYPSAQFWFEWNTQGYMVTAKSDYNAGEWSNFYSYVSGVNHVGVLNFATIDGYSETYISRDVWQATEYYEPWEDYFEVGNIIFVKTEIDGSTLKTTEIHVKHLFNENEIFIASRKVATNSVTVTTDYPQPYYPE